MSRTYHYHGFDIEVAVETDFSWTAGPRATTSVGLVAVVRISKAGASVAVFSPLRFGESQGKPFLSEADALMGGYSAGRRGQDDHQNGNGQGNNGGFGCWTFRKDLSRASR
jgi:hypothetical protein